MFCNVIVTRPFDQFFTYKLRKGQIVKEGSIVSVPFGKTENQIGLVLETLDSVDTSGQYKIKYINKIFESVTFNQSTIKFIKWISDYTLSPLGLVLKLFLINNQILSFKSIDKKPSSFDPISVTLNKEQKKASKMIELNLFKSFKPIVLEGVTGSGKTEVFFDTIKEVLKKNKQTLIMVPEISLTPQLENRFFERFGFHADIWHSKITENKRRSIWFRCYSGEPLIVIGARSSLFLPFTKLGLIVVDEEHDVSFKQEDNIRYHARDLAVVRAKIEKINIILSSATPSLETQNNINVGKYNHLFLSSQFSGLELPPIALVDLQKNKLKNNKWISNTIFLELEKCLKRKEQALLFLNRRGYSPLSLCIECGYRFQCQQCSSWLVMHQQKKCLICHHCGTILQIVNQCPQCSVKNSIKLIGPGVERVAEELEKYFPKKNISIMSSDNTNSPKKIKTIIDQFSNKKIDILVATQIMAKGYDFPNLSFVGVVDADTGLFGGDLRAIEKTFNLLQQVSGRAGRSAIPGKVMIQTYYPKQKIVQALKNRDRDSFIKEALTEREEFNMPPFGYITSIIISGASKSLIKNYALNLVQIPNREINIEILGPVEAPIFLLRGKYRYRILLKGKSRKKLNKFTLQMFEFAPKPSTAGVIIDVDPYSFF